jgi:Protein of unknown function (DUF2804)
VPASLAGMRALLTPPASILDPITRAPRVGSYRGGLPRVDLSPLAPGALGRLLKHKRWTYVGLASDEVFIAIAVAHLGYIANAFAFVFDRATRRMLVDRASLAPPFAASVGDTGGEGSLARVRLPGASVRIERPLGETAIRVQAAFRGLEVDARLETAAAPPAISAIVPVQGGLLNTTEKRLLLAVTGEATVLGRSLSLDGSLAGYDYTSGLLARRTIWRWAFALGRAQSGELVGLNLVEGFVGEAECALWIDGELIPLSEGRFGFNAARPLAPWEVRTADGSVDLRFAPGAAHADRTNLGLIASRFAQPVGLYSGTIRAPDGRELHLDSVLGVTEDQDMLW